MCDSFTIDLFGTIASVIIALAAVAQFGYIYLVQEPRQQKHQDKEWFHRLVIEPKLEEVFSFFKEVEENLEQSQDVIGRYLEIHEVVSLTDSIKNLSYQFRTSFIELGYPIDQQLAENIQASVDSFVDFYTEKLFTQYLNNEGYNEVIRRFAGVKSDIIAQLYYSKNSNL